MEESLSLHLVITYFFIRTDVRKNLTLGNIERSAELRPIPAAARSRAWVCGRSLPGIAGSHPAACTDVCLL